MQARKCGLNREPPAGTLVLWWRDCSGIKTLGEQAPALLTVLLSPTKWPSSIPFRLRWCYPGDFFFFNGREWPLSSLAPDPQCLLNVADSILMEPPVSNMVTHVSNHMLLKLALCSGFARVLYKESNRSLLRRSGCVFTLTRIAACHQRVLAASHWAVHMKRNLDLWGGISLPGWSTVLQAVDVITLRGQF